MTMEQHTTAAAVREAVELYVAGVRANDPETVKRAFSDDAVMWGYLGPTYVTQSGRSFADEVVATAPPEDPQYRYEVHSVEVHGSIASAVLEEQAYLGANFRNQFGLVLIEGVWRITSKVFTTT